MCAIVAFYCQGFDLAKRALLDYLESVKIKVDVTDREVLYCAAKASLRTKLSQVLIPLP